MPAVRAKKTARPQDAAANRALTARRGAAGVSFLYRGQTPTHALLPIAEYERLLRIAEGREIEDRLTGSRTKWIAWPDAAARLSAGRIAAARKQAGLTQKQLGERLNMPQSQISRIEKSPDRTNTRTLKRIAAALGADVSALLG